MYPRIPWELVANPFGSAEHTFGTTGVEGWSVCFSCLFIMTLQFLNRRCITSTVTQHCYINTVVTGLKCSAPPTQNCSTLYNPEPVSSTSSSHYVSPQDPSSRISSFYFSVLQVSTLQRFPYQIMHGFLINNTLASCRAHRSLLYYLLHPS
jgi:hypothetical protein